MRWLPCRACLGPNEAAPTEGPTGCETQTLHRSHPTPGHSTPVRRCFEKLPGRGASCDLLKVTQPWGRVGEVHRPLAKVRHTVLLMLCLPPTLGTSWVSGPPPRRPPPSPPPSQFQIRSKATVDGGPGGSGTWLPDGQDQGQGGLWGPGEAAKLWARPDWHLPCSACASHKPSGPSLSLLHPL